MSKWIDGYVNVNGLKLHYYRTGGDLPPIVMNHGAGDDGLCWTRTMMLSCLMRGATVNRPLAKGITQPNNG